MSNTEEQELAALRRDWTAAADAARRLDILSARGVGGWLEPGRPSPAWTAAWDELRRALDLPPRSDR